MFTPSRLCRKASAARRPFRDCGRWTGFTLASAAGAGFNVSAVNIYYPMMIWQYLFPHCDNCMSQLVKKSKIGWAYLVSVAETVRLLEAYVSIFVIPAPHRVRDKLQRESSFSLWTPALAGVTSSIFVFRNIN